MMEDPVPQHSQASESSHFAYLLPVLLLTLVLGPFLKESPGGRAVLTVMFVAVLVISTHVIRRRGRLFVTGLVLVILALAGKAWGLFAPSVAAYVARTALMAIFTGYAGAVMLADVLRARRITSDKLLGAICVYLMIGLTWAALFTLVDLLSPAAFAAPEQDAALLPDISARLEVSGRMIYFSFVTLATLGYGDIAPLTPTARTLAWLEAVLGQLYIAVLVARLVGLHISHSAQRDT
jgi:hypothetical protein